MSKHWAQKSRQSEHNKAGPWSTIKPARPTEKRTEEQQMRSAIVRFITACSLAAAIALTPRIESAAIAAEPIVFGLVDEVTGPQAEAGVLQVQGAKLAV